MVQNKLSNFKPSHNANFIYFLFKKLLENSSLLPITCITSVCFTKRILAPA